MGRLKRWTLPGCTMDQFSTVFGIRAWLVLPTGKLKVYLNSSDSHKTDEPVALIFTHHFGAVDADLAADINQRIIRPIMLEILKSILGQS